MRGEIVRDMQFMLDHGGELPVYDAACEYYEAVLTEEGNRPGLDEPTRRSLSRCVSASYCTPPALGSPLIVLITMWSQPSTV